MFGIPLSRINWKTSIFLGASLVLSLIGVPLYLCYFSLDWFQIALFLVLFTFSSMSITLGYHRCFSHRAFQAHWALRLFTLIFGATAFENSALMWSSEHRRHHKHVDHDDDPYNISNGFFYAHIGWLLVKMNPQPPFDNVLDLQRDKLVMWQHRYVQGLAFLFGFIMPAAIGWAWNGPVGALAAFVFSGVTRVVCVQHTTFFINSLCHTIGKRPYSSRCSARDSWLMALLTFGEGYHNYHHEFQHDYRNGVKPWQWDPTKWAVWIFSKLRLATNLRRVPEDKIQAAQQREKQRLLKDALPEEEPSLIEFAALGERR